MQNEEWNICPFSIDDDFVHCCIYYILHYNHWLLKMAPSLLDMSEFRTFGPPLKCLKRKKDEGLSKCLK